MCRCPDGQEYGAAKHTGDGADDSTSQSETSPSTPRSDELALAEEGGAERKKLRGANMRRVIALARPELAMLSLALASPAWSP